MLSLSALEILKMDLVRLITDKVSLKRDFS